MTTPAAYARALKKLLPQGALWRLEADSLLLKVLLAFGDELARVDARGLQLIEETDPRTASETISDWERMLGLPDEDLTQLPSTLAERRLAVAEKYLRAGGQTPAYYVGIAVLCGYGSGTTVCDGYGHTVARAGRLRAGQRLYGEAWAHYWRMEVELSLGPALPQEVLERIINRVKPAHTVVTFTYV